MILTGKAKIDFYDGIVEIIEKKYNEKINDKESAINWICYANDLILFPHIIEWFDSVGIIISIRWEWSTKTFQTSIFSNNNTFDVVHLPHHNERQKATKQAIIEANEIYNQKHLS